MTETNPDLDNDGDVDDIDLATAMANWSGPGKSADGPGDTDGDGDVDDADLANILSAYTGPLPPQNDIEAGDVNAELRKGGKVKLPPASVVKGGGLEITNSDETILTVDGPGKRPIIEVDRDGRAISNRTSRIDRLHISGIGMRSAIRDRSAGARIRLSSREDQYVKSLEIVDCYAEGLDAPFEIVDDWPRIQERQGKGNLPGRINLKLFALNISNRAYGSDSHSGGLYVEGLDEGGVIVRNVFHMSGWIEAWERNKKSHGIYAQSLGAPIAICDENVFSQAAANAAQFRAGVKQFNRNIITGCSLGPWLRWGNRVTNNVLLDQVDIDPDVPKEHRGHGYIVGSYDVFERNLAARRNGSDGARAAYRELPKGARNNVAVRWTDDGKNFEVEGERYRSVHDNNRTIDDDPGIPTFVDIDAYINRERGEPFVPTTGFIGRCWGAVS